MPWPYFNLDTQLLSYSNQRDEMPNVDTPGTIYGEKNIFSPKKQLILPTCQMSKFSVGPKSDVDQHQTQTPTHPPAHTESIWEGWGGQTSWIGASCKVPSNGSAVTLATHIKGGGDKRSSPDSEVKGWWLERRGDGVVTVWWETEVTIGKHELDGLGQGRNGSSVSIQHRPTDRANI